MKRFQAMMEWGFFGVCTKLGEKFGFASGAVRMYFIYLSFFTFGSPIIIYIILAFLMDMRKFYRQNKSTIWDF